MDLRDRLGVQLILTYQLSQQGSTAAGKSIVCFVSITGWIVVVVVNSLGSLVRVIISLGATVIEPN